MSMHPEHGLDLLLQVRRCDVEGQPCASRLLDRGDGVRGLGRLARGRDEFVGVGGGEDGVGEGEAEAGGGAGDEVDFWGRGGDGRRVGVVGFGSGRGIGLEWVGGWVDLG